MSLFVLERVRKQRVLVLQMTRPVANPFELLDSCLVIAQVGDETVAHLFRRRQRRRQIGNSFPLIRYFFGQPLELAASLRLDDTRCSSNAAANVSRSDSARDCSIAS